MKILVACEESQAVTIELRKLGHEAYSCDIELCSGGHPEWHIKHDVLPLINGHNEWKAPFPVFKTCDGCYHDLPKRWDMIIAFPPCTYLTVTGNRWFNVERYGEIAIQRCVYRKQAIEFFMKFINADCDKIAVENPVGIMSTEYQKPDCIIQPYEFGHPERKRTCLWLKGIPKLKPTKIVKPKIIKCASGAIECNWHMETLPLPAKERSKIRSKTFPGVARAMATQWAGPAYPEEISP